MIKKRKNKKAWIRIVEAFFAIMLVLVVIVSVYTREAKKFDYSEEIYEFQTTILYFIANDAQLRQFVLEEKTFEIKEIIKDKIPGGFDFDVKICDLKVICALDYYKSEIYASERIISSTLKTYNPKILKIFMWMKED